MILTLNICRAIRGLKCSSTLFNNLSLRRNFANHAQKMSKITHVIFDFDGVILDTETIFYDINMKALKHYGVKYNVDLKLGQMGRRLDEGTEWLLNTTGLTKQGVSVSEYIKLYDKIMITMLDKIPVLPGAFKLIEHLHKSGVSMAICTGSSTEEFRLKTQKCKNIIEKFPVIVLAGDDLEVKHGKPAADPYIITMKRMTPLPTDPKSVLVFEDSVNGVLSGLAAGNTVIWIPQKQFKPKTWNAISAELEPKVAEILESLEKFDPTKYGFPSY